VPIGKPIDNTKIYILDKFRNLLPAGAAGEICLGGVSLARGYLNNPDLTDEKFITNPFINGERIYCTGDLGRWLADGNIEFLGRIDDQLKINGYKIELHKISSELQKHIHVKDAIVVVQIPNGKDKELIAYITGDAKAAELKEYLKEKLPAYMVPDHFIYLDEIPRTENGKVNKKGLPLAESIDIHQLAYVAPSTNTEKILAKIWAEVLDISVEDLSIKSDFFNMGGHSIKAIRLLELLHKELVVKLKLKELFSETTIEEQAILVSDKELKAYEMIEAVTEESEYKLSSAQRRLWILNHFEGAQTAYNLPYVILLEGKLEKNSLIRALKIWQPAMRF
jgi:aryl carrier-like protein